jgi:hypothetical protein
MDCPFAPYLPLLVMMLSATQGVFFLWLTASSLAIFSWFYHVIKTNLIVSSLKERKT